MSTAKSSRACRRSTGELLDGWRHILGSPALRPVFYNRLLVGGLIMAVEPVLLPRRDYPVPPDVAAPSARVSMTS